MIEAPPVTVGISDCVVTQNPHAVLATHALGSCIAVAIHDPVACVAGLLHFMLPEADLDREKATARPFMFADTGIPILFHRSYELGAQKQRLIVTAIGGAQVLNTDDSFHIGKRNYLALRKILWKANVMLHHEDIGGTLPRSVRFEVASGRIVVSHGRAEKEIVQAGKYRSKAKHGL